MSLESSCFDFERIYCHCNFVKSVPLAPGKAPTDVRAEALFATQIKVSWTKIARRYIVGNLAEYVVFYSAENATLPQKKSVSGSSDSTILMALEPDTTYSIQVAGLNETRGIGPLSAVATARTFEGKHISA